MMIILIVSWVIKGVIAAAVTAVQSECVSLIEVAAAAAASNGLLWGAQIDLSAPHRIGGGGGGGQERDSCDKITWPLRRRRSQQMQRVIKRNLQSSLHQIGKNGVVEERIGDTIWHG